MDGLAKNPFLCYPDQGTNQKNHLKNFKMALKTKHKEKIRQMFEEGLKRVQQLEKIERMKMRSKIRREINLVASWKNPKSDMILARWESRLSDVFSLFPRRFKDDLTLLLQDIIKKK